MVPELAVVFLAAAAIVLVPLFVAGNLWSRARNRGRLPSPPALATIAFGLATTLSNGLFVFRVIALDGAGVTGLSIVTALWTTMALAAIWVALHTQRVRLYAARPTDIEVVVQPLPYRAAAAEPVVRPVAAAPASAPIPAASRLVVYRDDPTPDVPCATPLRGTQMPPTIRDLVRAGALQATAAPGTLATPDVPPDALVLQVTPRARFPVRAMAETARLHHPVDAGEPAFHSSRNLILAPTS